MTTAPQNAVELLRRYAAGERTFIGASLRGARLCGASLRDADLHGTDLRGADLRGASLRGADLRGARLCGADLRNASLRGAYLRGADLHGASLRDASLGGQWIVQGATRSDGYPFFLMKLTDDKVPMVRAGCRYLSLADAWTHWSITRRGQSLLEETVAIIDSLVQLAVLRGHMKRPTATGK